MVPTENFLEFNLQNQTWSNSVNSWWAEIELEMSTDKQAVAQTQVI